MSVGVLPLVAAQGNAAQVQGADVIAQDIMAMLSRSNTMIQVVPLPMAQAKEANGDKSLAARFANVRYLVDAQVRREKRETVVSLSLAEASTEELVWNESASLSDEGKPEERLRTLHACLTSFERASFRRSSASHRSATQGTNPA